MYFWRDSFCWRVLKMFLWNEFGGQIGLSRHQRFGVWIRPSGLHKKTIFCHVFFSSHLWLQNQISTRDFLIGHYLVLISILYSNSIKTLGGSSDQPSNLQSKIFLIILKSIYSPICIIQESNSLLCLMLKKLKKLWPKTIHLHVIFKTFFAKPLGM